MYIPMLTKEVVEGNLRGEKPFINIKVTGREGLGAYRSRRARVLWLH